MSRLSECLRKLPHVDPVDAEAIQRQAIELGDEGKAVELQLLDVGQEVERLRAAVGAPPPSTEAAPTPETAVQEPAPPATAEDQANGYLPGDAQAAATKTKLNKDTEHVLYSISRMGWWATKLENAGLTGPEVEAARKNLSEFATAGRPANVIESDPTLAPEPDDSRSPIRDNMDYGISVDLDTKCPKQQVFRSHYDAVAEVLGRDLTTNERWNVVYRMLEAGVNAPCSYCYVESSRIGKKTGYGDAGGITNVPKGYKPYFGQLLAYADRMPLLNMRAGIRFQSATDTKAEHIFDLMQVITDASLIEGMGHAYAKEESLPAVFGNTGLKINLSTMGREVRGELVFDTNAGMSMDRAVELVAINPDDIGIMLMGTNARTIEAGFQDPRIGMIIAYHASGLTKSVYEALGWEDFTPFQRESYLSEEQAGRDKDAVLRALKELAKGKPGRGYAALDDAAKYWIGMQTFNRLLPKPLEKLKALAKTYKPPIGIRAFWNHDLAKYLDLCGQYGLAPKFERWVKTPGYEKLLVDVAAWRTPQKVMQPVFNFEMADKYLRDYIAKGGRANITAVNPDVVKKTVQDIRKGPQAFMDQLTKYRNSVYRGPERFQPGLLEQSARERAAQAMADAEENRAVLRNKLRARLAAAKLAVTPEVIEEAERRYMERLMEQARGGEGILAQFAGVQAQGANLGLRDQAEGLEAEGKSAEEIFKATGWIRGADQKWRFEISDKDVQFKNGDEELAKAKRRANEITRRMDELGEAGAGLQPGGTRTPEYNALMQEQFDLYDRVIHREVGVNVIRAAKSKKGWLGRLSETIAHPRLFEAYPELKDIFVELTLDKEKSSGGDYSVIQSGSIRSRRISLHAPDAKAAKKHLLHEIQHSIQDREDFNRGGMPDIPFIKRVAPKELEREYESLKELAKSRPTLEQWRDRVWGEALGSKESAPKDLVRFGAAAEAEHNVLKSIYASLDSGDTMAFEPAPPGEEVPADPFDALLVKTGMESRLQRHAAFSIYKALAGEVEARATAERGGMTEAARAKTAPELIGIPIHSTGERMLSTGFLEQNQDALGFYSSLARTVEALDFKTIPAKDLLQRLRGLQQKGQLKLEELEDLGLTDWLETQPGKVEKDQVLAFIRDGGPRLEEVRKTSGLWRVTYTNRKDRLNRTFAASPNFPTEAAANAWIEEMFPGRSGEFSAYHETSDPEMSTLYNTYTLDGGDNYREVLLTLPPSEAEKTAKQKLEAELKLLEEEYAQIHAIFRKGEAGPDINTIFNRLEQIGEEIVRVKRALFSSDPDVKFTTAHWPEPNVLAHLRMADHVGKNQERVLLLEELQSDWHQAGRREGYEQKQVRQYHVKKGDATVAEFDTEAEARAYIAENGPGLGLWQLPRTPGQVVKSGVADAPFKKTESWAMLAFKRALRMAVEEGYDAIAWTPGQAQAERYDLSKQIDSVSYNKQKNGTISYSVRKDGHEVHQDLAASPEDLERTLGKELAKKILDGEGQEVGAPKGSGKLEGLDLQVGGEGMKAFYDQMLPKAVQKYIAKLDKSAKVSPTQLRTTPGTEVWLIPITEAMRNEVLAGQALYQKAIDDAVSALLAENAGEAKGAFDYREFLDKDVANPKAYIDLFRSADRSTFAHEAAHFFFFSLQRMASADMLNEGGRARYDTLVKWMGGTDTKALEKFARGVEAYLLEGKAPTVELADTFQSFRKWLTAIYQAVANLFGSKDPLLGLEKSAGQPVELNQEIRDIMDRLLASEAEIEEARKYYQASGALYDLLAPEAQAALAPAKEAAERAEEEKDVQKYLKAYKEAMGGIQGIRDEVANEVDQDPIYASLDGARAAGGFPAEALGSFAAAIAELHGKALVKQKGGKANVQAAATAAGFSTAEEYLQTLAKTPAKAEAIRTLVQERLQQAEENIRAALAADEPVPGEEALHTDARLEYLVAEANILEGQIEAANRRRMARTQAKAVRDAAAKLIAEMPLSKATSYHAFARAELRAGREALRAMQAGDVAAAHDWRTKQILNHAMVLESVKARASKERIERRALSAARSKTVEFAFTEQIRKLLQDYGLGTPSTKPLRPDDMPPLAQMISPDTESPVAIQGAIADWILKGENKGAELTYEQFRDLWNAIAFLEKQGRRVLVSEALGEEKAIDDYVEDCTAKAADMPDAKGIRNVESLFGIPHKLQWVWRSLVAMSSQVRFTFARLDGGEPLKLGGAPGPFYRLVQALDKAGVAESTVWKGLRDEVNGISRDLEAVVVRLTRERGPYFDVVPEHPDAVPVLETMRQKGQHRWTAENLISILLNTGNPGNFKALLEGYQLNYQDILTISTLFHEKELRILDRVWGLLEKTRPLVEKTFEQLNGVPMRLVEAVPMVLWSKEGKGVTLKGGYYPIMLDATLSDRAMTLTEREDMDLMAREAGVSRMYGPQDRFTKERKGTGLPPRLTFSVLMTHLRDAVRYATFAPAIRDVDRITKTDGFRRIMREKDSEQMYRQIRPWLKSIARPQTVKALGETETILEGQRRLATTVLLGYQLTTIVKQLPGLLQSIPKIGLWPTARALVRLAASPKETLLGAATGKHPIFEASVYLADRRERFNQAMADAFHRAKPHVGVTEIGGRRFSWKQVQEFGLEGIRMMDSLTVMAAWQAAFDVAFKKNPDTAAAVEAADDAVRQTQPDANPIDLSGFQRPSNWTKLFAAFMTPALKIGNQLGTFYSLWQAGKMSNVDFFRHMWWLAVLPPVATGLTMALVRGEPPDEEELALDVVGWLAQGDPTANAMFRAVKDGEAGFGDLPVFGGVARLGKTGAAFRRWFGDDTDGDPKTANELAWAVGSTIEWFAGVPAVRVAKTALDGMADLEEGETDNPLRLLVRRSKNRPAEEE
ncbi:MAG TPA: LPD23 domain-containing protein [Sedimentisphaerales bacterium]|nr:LPD23 domain-containing protein [Sedimentisphaerales bacterium]